MFGIRIENFAFTSLCEGKLEYNAQSPDEAALVNAARNFGYVFKVCTRCLFWLCTLTHSRGSACRGGPPSQ